MKLPVTILIFLVLLFSTTGFATAGQQSEFLTSDKIFSKQVAEHHFALGDIYLELYDAVARYPLTKDWPVRFEGSFENYTLFDKYLNIRPMLENKETIITSKWSNAVIDHYFLDYIFFPKIEWPRGAEK